MAWATALMEEWVESPSLRRHCQCVGTALRAEAERFEASNPDLWQVAGILHDFDYERHPDHHPTPGLAALREMGAPPPILNAIAAHVDVTLAAQGSALDRALFACDELCGFLTAVAAVRPSKSILDVEVSSVLKKFKTPAFAAGVHREDVVRGADLLGRTLEEHIELVLAALKGDAERLGLAGA